MKKNYSAWIFMAAVFIIPFSVFGVVKWYEHKFTKLPVLVGEDHVIQDYMLTDHNGNAVTDRALENKITVVDFFFTHCPVVCPKMTRSMKRVQQLFADRKNFQLVSFTVDPERDSPERLRDYMQKMDIGRNWTMITGSKKEIYLLARNSFKIVATDGDGGPDDFIHSELLVLIDKNKQIRGYYNGTIPSEVDDLLRDFQRLEKE